MGWVRSVSVRALTAAFACALMWPGEASAQDYYHWYATKSGCQVWGDEEEFGPGFSWSGKCNANNHIEGNGTLTYYSSEGKVNFEFIGEFVDGRPHGPFQYNAFVGDDAWPSPYHKVRYDMGCSVSSTGQANATCVAASARAGGSAPGTRASTANSDVFNSGSTLAGSTLSGLLGSGLGFSGGAPKAGPKVPDVPLTITQQVGNTCVSVRSLGTSLNNTASSSYSIATTLELRNDCDRDQVLEAIVGLGDQPQTRPIWGGFLELQRPLWGFVPSSGPAAGLNDQFLAFAMPAGSVGTAKIFQTLSLDGSTDALPITAATAACNFNDGKGHAVTMFRDQPFHGFNRVHCLPIGVP